MKIKIENIDINYETYGYGKPVVFLHGWGANLHTFDRLVNKLPEGFMAYLIDLPGFGKTEIGLPLGLLDVTMILHELFIKLEIKNPILIGHSYGGRLSILYASMYDVSKLVLVSSAGIKQKLGINKKLKIRVYKILKKCHIKIKMGSKDYIDSDNVKRKMLVDAVNLDLKAYMNKINVPTLLIYGKADDVTHLSLGYEIKENIQNSELIEMDECGHFPYIDAPTIFMLILNSFLLSDTNC